MSIFTMIKAEFRHKKGNFIGVMFLMFLVTFVATVSFSINESSQKRAEQSLTESGIGDVWCAIGGTVLTDEMLEKVISYEEVEKVYHTFGVMLSNTNLATVAGEEMKDRFLFQTYDKEKMPYPVYREDYLGFLENPEPLKKGEIYLPVSFKSVYSCKVGDIVEVETKNVKTSFVIKAFVEDVTLGNPLLNGMKNVWVSEEDYEMLKTACDALDPLLSMEDIITIYQKEDSTLTEKEFREELNKRTGIISSSEMVITKEEFITYTTMVVDIFSAVMVMFAILLFIGALIIAGHSIASTIEMNYVNLGVLKSQGFRKRELQAIYFCQYMLAGLIGECVGFFMAFFAVHYVRSLLIDMMGFLPEDRVAWKVSLLVMALMLCLIFAFTLIKTRRIGKISPMRAISGGRESIYFSNRIRIPLSQRGLTIRLMLKQIFDNGKQYVSSLLIVAMLVYFMMAEASTLSCMDEENMLKDYFGLEFDLCVEYGESIELKEEVENMIKEYTGMESSYSCPSIYLTLKGDAIYVTAPESGDVFTNVFEGREPRYDNEIIITEIIAEKYDLKIGDRVFLEYGQESKEFLVTGYYQSVVNTGKCLNMIKQGLERYDIPEEDLNGYNYLVSDREQIRKLVEELQEKFESRLVITDIQVLRESLQTISDASLASSLLIYAVAILFILATAYMVCDKVFLKEKNDYGIYKSQGFTTGNLRMQFSLRFFTVALSGGILGGVFNMLTNDTLMGIALKAMGITHFETNYTFMDYAVPIFVLAMVFFLFSYIISGRMKKVDTKSLIVE